jgi:hypothetical protein
LLDKKLKHGNIFCVLFPSVSVGTRWNGNYKQATTVGVKPESIYHLYYIAITLITLPVTSNGFVV